MPTLILMIGTPGSGKTHYRSQHCMAGAKVISPDDLLTEKWDYQWTPDRAMVAWKIATKQLEDEILAHACGEGKYNTYIFDAVFATPKTRKKYVHMAKNAGWTVKAVYMTTPLSVCKERNAQRAPNRRVPEMIMDNMAKKMTAPTAQEGFDEIIQS